jgi:hypothetical protein
MIRDDQSVLEKRGCRSQTGWPRAVSETVNSWMASWLGVQSQGNPQLGQPSTTTTDSFARSTSGATEVERKPAGLDTAGGEKKGH